MTSDQERGKEVKRKNKKKRERIKKEEGEGIRLTIEKDIEPVPCVRVSSVGDKQVVKRGYSVSVC